MSSTQVAGLDLALELLHGALRGLERRRERRRSAGVELPLEPTRRDADLVEPRRRRELRRVAEDRRGARAPPPPRPRSPPVPRARAGRRGSRSARRVAAAGRVDGHLAQRRDRHGCAKLGAARHDRAVVADAEPAARPVGSVERAEVHAPARLRLGRENARDDVARVCVRDRELGSALQLVGERHVAHNRRRAVGRRQGAVRAARPVVRPRRRGALASARTRAGVASSSRGFPATAVTCSTSRPEPASSRRSSSAADSGSRASTRARRCSPARAGGSAIDVELVEASAESLPVRRRRVRPPDGHVPPPLRRRSGGDARELARVVRPGGVVASLEFGVPGGLARPAWELYVRAGLPLAGRVLRHGWREVGDFLGGSIRSFWETYPLERQLELWSRSGHPRTSRCGG